MSNLNDKIYSIKRDLLQDSRGWFLKVINGTEPHNRLECEVYITSAKPGESKGGHYHLVANEWFTLVKGKALLTTIDISSKEKAEFSLNSDEPETLYIPAGIAHNFYNSGDTDFILIAFTNVKYDPSDTISYNF
ncbi:MAG TPA: dTDP-4-dehydrorhamnose 3,5-epimerase family protein [Hanamia sp.]|nr:dTDP-4-dehydrorhamnose 3,5-epimerase family protein [Hanamia sp.]